MFTPAIRSEMLTIPVPVQSPTHGLARRVGVAVGRTDPDGVAVGDGEAAIPDSVQSGSQPSSGSRLPSSHCSVPVTMPLPQPVGVQLESQPSPSTVLPSSQLSPSPG
jgi:hypothetical protein